MLAKLMIVSGAFVLIGAAIAFRKPKPGKESLDWLGGFIAGLALILFGAAAFAAIS